MAVQESIGEHIEALPPRYAGWLRSILSAPLPQERHATCLTCAMCKSPTEGERGHTQEFHPDVKCCTYVPMLWNFLIGDVLCDASPDTASGRASVERRLERAIGLTPLGLDASQVFKTLYAHLPQAFGNAPSMRCPHYLVERGGLCGIWKYRNAVCATYFCKHEEAAEGLLLWTRVRNLLETIEERLARYCIHHLLDNPEARAESLPVPYRRNATTSSFQSNGRAFAVREWTGEAREFFIDCANLARGWTWERVTHELGTDLELYAEAVRDAFQTPPLPKRISRGSLSVESVSNVRSRYIGTYSVTDLLPVSDQLLQLIALLPETASCEEVLSQIEELEPANADTILRQLLAFRVLNGVPA